MDVAPAVSRIQTGQVSVLPRRHLMLNTSVGRSAVSSYQRPQNSPTTSVISVVVDEGLRNYDNMSAYLDLSNSQNKDTLYFYNGDALSKLGGLFANMANFSPAGIFVSNDLSSNKIVDQNGNRTGISVAPGGKYYMKKAAEQTDSPKCVSGTNVAGCTARKTSGRPKVTVDYTCSQNYVTNNNQKAGQDEQDVNNNNVYVSPNCVVQKGAIVKAFDDKSLCYTYDNSLRTNVYVSCDYLTSGLPNNEYTKKRRMEVKLAAGESLTIPGYASPVDKFYIVFYDDVKRTTISGADFASAKVFDVSRIFEALESAAGKVPSGIYQYSIGNYLDGAGKKYYDSAGNATETTRGFAIGFRNASVVAYVGWEGGSIGDYNGEKDSVTQCPVVSDVSKVWSYMGYNGLEEGHPEFVRYVKGRSGNDISDCGIIVQYSGSDFCRLAKWNGKEYGDLLFTVNTARGPAVYGFQPVVNCNKTNSHIDNIIQLHPDTDQSYSHVDYPVGERTSVRNYGLIDVGIVYGEALPSIKPLETIEQKLSPHSVLSTGMRGVEKYWDSDGTPKQVIQNDTQFNQDFPYKTAQDGIPMGVYRFDVSDASVNDCYDVATILAGYEYENYGGGDDFDYSADYNKGVVRWVSLAEEGDNFLTTRHCSSLMKETFKDRTTGANVDICRLSGYMTNIGSVRYGIIDCNVTDDAFRAATRNVSSAYNGPNIWVYEDEDIKVNNRTYGGISLTFTNGTLPSLENFVKNMTCTGQRCQMCSTGWTDDGKCNGAKVPKKFKGVYGVDYNTHNTVMYYDENGKPIQANMPTNSLYFPNHMFILWEGDEPTNENDAYYYCRTHLNDHANCYWWCIYNPDDSVCED